MKDLNRFIFIQLELQSFECRDSESDKTFGLSVWGLGKKLDKIFWGF